MNLHNHSTAITPQEATCLHNVVQAVRQPLEAKRQRREPLTDQEHSLLQDTDTARKWLASVNEGLYQAWTALPEGSALKTAYAEDVWCWSDRDMHTTEDE